MRKGRTLLYGGVLGAALGVMLAPRRGESRRLALTRLRLSLGRASGSLDAFAGTPCATAGPPCAGAEGRPAASHLPADE